MRTKTERGSLWELAVLALLREEPMHPYEMLRLLKERRKDQVLVLKRGSLYHAIGRLARSGLIEAHGVEREGGRPERTTYRLTAAGRRELVARLRRRIATPQAEPSELMGSLSFLVHLTPDDAMGRLGSRAEALSRQVAALDAALREAGRRVDRIHLIESEYQLATQRAELDWVRRRIGELKSGRLGWSTERILREVRAERRRRPRKERRG